MRFALSLVPVVDPCKLLPDVCAEPMLAAMPACPRNGTPRSSWGQCWKCGQRGHKMSNCPKGGSGNPAARGRAKFGQYDGSARVNAIAAEELSDDDLRQGNDQA